jgi:hypothetical protein
MTRKSWTRGVVMLGALVVSVGLSGRAAQAQTISVRVAQVLASNKSDTMDPTLGALGERLKRTYPYRSFKRAGSGTRTGQVGKTLSFDLYGGMAMTLELLGYQDPTVSMRATVGQLVRTDLRVQKGRSMIISVPLGEDKLILDISPSVK